MLLALNCDEKKVIGLISRLLTAILLIGPIQTIFSLVTHAFIGNTRGGYFTQKKVRIACDGLKKV